MKDEVESLVRSGVKDALLGSQIGDAKSINQSQNDIVERRQHLRCLTAADGAAIFTQGDIAAPMQTILNLPVLSDEMEQTFGRCDLRREASHAIDCFGGRVLAAGNASLELKDLCDIIPLGAI